MAKKKAKKKVKEKKGLSRPLSAFVGMRVRNERARKKLSTTVLALKMGLSQAQVSRLELGKQGWRMEQVEKVSAILGLPVSVLAAPKTAVEVTVRYANGTSKKWKV